MSDRWHAQGKRIITKTLAQYAAEAAAGDGKGIACPECGCKHWDIVRTVRLEGRVKRERICRYCKYPMTTYEAPDPPPKPAK